MRFYSKALEYMHVNCRLGGVMTCIKPFLVSWCHAVRLSQRRLTWKQPWRCSFQIATRQLLDLWQLRYMKINGIGLLAQGFPIVKTIFYTQLQPPFPLQTSPRYPASGAPGGGFSDSCIVYNRPAVTHTGCYAHMVMWSIVRAADLLPVFLKHPGLDQGQANLRQICLLFSLLYPILISKLLCITWALSLYEEKRWGAGGVQLSNQM